MANINENELIGRLSSTLRVAFGVAEAEKTAIDVAIARRSGAFDAIVSRIGKYEAAREEAKADALRLAVTIATDGAPAPNARAVVKQAVLAEVVETPGELAAEQQAVYYESMAESYDDSYVPGKVEEATKRVFEAFDHDSVVVGFLHDRFFDQPKFETVISLNEYMAEHVDIDPDMAVYRHRAEALRAFLEATEDIPTVEELALQAEVGEEIRARTLSSEIRVPHNGALYSARFRVRINHATPLHFDGRIVKAKGNRLLVLVWHAGEKLLFAVKGKAAEGDCVAVATFLNKIPETNMHAGVLEHVWPGQLVRLANSIARDEPVVEVVICERASFDPSRVICPGNHKKTGFVYRDAAKTVVGCPIFEEMLHVAQVTIRNPRERKRQVGVEARKLACPPPQEVPQGIFGLEDGGSFVRFDVDYGLKVGERVLVKFTRDGQGTARPLGASPKTLSGEALLQMAAESTIRVEVE